MDGVWISQSEHGFAHKRSVGLQTTEKYPWSLLHWGGFKDVRPAQFLNEDINANIREALRTYSGDELARKIDEGVLASPAEQIERRELPGKHRQLESAHGTLQTAHGALQAEHGALGREAESLLRYQAGQSSKSSVPEIGRAASVSAKEADWLAKDIAREQAELSKYRSYFLAQPAGTDLRGYASTLNAREDSLAEAQRRLAAMRQEHGGIAGLQGRFPESVSGRTPSAFPYTGELSSMRGFERGAPLPPAPAVPATPKRGAPAPATPHAPPQRTAPRQSSAKKKKLAAGV